MRLGIDVGGTNTDAVLIDGKDVVATVKRPTTKDIRAGIVDAISQVIDAAGIFAHDLSGVMIGTTQFTNAFVERRNLDRVAIIRLSLPACQSIGPLADWPDDLKATIGDNIYLASGGYEYDGREISPLDEGKIREIAADIGAKGLGSVAVSSVFAPVNGEMERRVAEILSESLSGVAISLSSGIGRLGLLERENATIMNACLTSHARSVLDSFHASLAQLNITAPFFITQNDGTLMLPDQARRFPVLTFSSGPTNSMRGASWLTGIKEALVMDVGGTTTDIGVLHKGFPRESSLSVDIGGVTTNFRMPDILAMGLGGGSIISMDGGCAVGPRSVGYQLLEEGIVFGGDTLTASDIAVAGGQAVMGDPERVSDLSKEKVDIALRTIQTMLETGVDRMKTREDDVVLILVGGGGILAGDRLKGVARIERPEHFAVANAIGAAIAQVGGETDRIFSYAELGREQALAEAQSIALQYAVDAGADADTLRIVDIEEVPLAYLPNHAVRVRVKAVGDLA
uniref:N-methylhydantoinase A/oxoprolinase/acetone carboxylase, beta subunit n=1 Tax=Candidatus Kentrum sp. FW TaxID=2126338 RepID=A0A450SMS0_9GAMM|nr:MAG: N-methylhydantoinase A/oxoprolinase/acetone carboxylase, beta subunit [Candidatus Kentron sp. FW]